MKLCNTFCRKYQIRLVSTFFRSKILVQFKIDQTLSSSPYWLVRTCVHSHSSPSPLINFIIHRQNMNLGFALSHFYCFFIIVAVDWTVIGGATGARIEVHVASLGKGFISFEPQKQGKCSRQKNSPTWQRRPFSRPSPSCAADPLSWRSHPCPW